MSQKDQNDKMKPDDKWRDLAENEEPEAVSEVMPEADSVDKAVTDKVNILEKQVEFLKDQYARSQAEMENTRRRTEQEVSKARKFGVERLISELVPVAESLTKALEISASDNAQAKHMHEGIGMTLIMLDKLLEKNGVISIDPAVGEVFDPMQHEAMAMQPDPEAKTNTIVKVLQKGYALHGRVIRAAMVIVAA